MVDAKYSRTSKVITQHSDRSMKSYQILDGELKHISTMNTWATLFYSLSGSCATLAFGLWSDLFIEGSPAAGASEAIPVLETTFLIGTGIFLVLALWATLANRTEIQRIKRESGDDSPTFIAVCVTWVKSVRISNRETPGQPPA